MRVHFFDRDKKPLGHADVASHAGPVPRLMQTTDGRLFVRQAGHRADRYFEVPEEKIFLVSITPPEAE